MQSARERAKNSGSLLRPAEYKEKSRGRVSSLSTAAVTLVLLIGAHWLAGPPPGLADSVSSLAFFRREEHQARDDKETEHTIAGGPRSKVTAKSVIKQKQNKNFPMKLENVKDPKKAESGSLRDVKLDEVP
ncbi:hypothetical protein ElyMa_002083300 [Elysia marginata]|uniref:Uncharacterized protein n=1 Tax=Elysia marginata TaxID=1093978 RepID=A0AAV4FBX8_9GAST|nr:hypothetical protein ElyMa_002083300 [Elysia marginata]